MTMAKFGFLANSDSCTAVRGVLAQLMTHFCLVLVLVFLAVVVGVMNVGAGAVGAGVVDAEVVGVLLLALDIILEQLG